ncbi:hypothetical protein BCS94_06830 [Vibrio breoganii]|nr:hypothetical protein BCS94_06830 [Vibrio breoganii]
MVNRDSLKRLDALEQSKLPLVLCRTHYIKRDPSIEGVELVKSTQFEYHWLINPEVKDLERVFKEYLPPVGNTPLEIYCEE